MRARGLAPRPARQRFPGSNRSGNRSPHNAAPVPPSDRCSRSSRRSTSHHRWLVRRTAQSHNVGRHLSSMSRRALLACSPARPSGGGGRSSVHAGPSGQRAPWAQAEPGNREWDHVQAAGPGNAGWPSACWTQLLGGKRQDPGNQDVVGGPVWAEPVAAAWRAVARTSPSLPAFLAEPAIP